MPLHFLRRARILCLLPCLAVYAQDAGMVLRTSVSYTTQRATLTLTDDQRRQADELARQAREATQARKYGEALRRYYHGMAVMRNQPWSPATEFAASLEGRLEHDMLEPGSKATVSLRPLYGCQEADDADLTASVSIKEQVLVSKLAIDPSTLPFSAPITLPDLPPGDYTLHVRLSGVGDTPASTSVKSLPFHIEALAADANRLRDRLARIAKKNSAAATAEYSLALYDLADRGEVNPHRFKFRDEFSAANALLDSLEAGRDPFAGRRGDLRKAYRSAVDQTLQPYRLFIPTAYDGAKPAPLVIALHGMGGDENSMFDSYGSGALKREAERVGFLVACPKGRDSASMYRGSAEQDVLDVLAEVQRDYRVDASRIYLMGHSMGGYGTWSVAMAHPDLFAALGPISGGGSPAGMAKIRHIPEYVVHGDDDRTVNVSQSRQMVEAGRTAGAEITYVEIPGGSHVSVVAPQFGPMLDFFARKKKSATKEHQ